jgi:3-phenylpropionate/trans-cinnamate dioxygenase ferredoxin component
MGTTVEAGNISQIPPGSMKRLKTGASDILLANVGGKIYAVDNSCPHMGGDLSKGKLDGTIVTCPLHGSQFDVSSGQVVRWLKGSGIVSSIGNAFKHPSEIRRYEVIVKGENISIKT